MQYINNNFVCSFDCSLDCDDENNSDNSADFMHTTGAQSRFK